MYQTNKKAKNRQKNHYIKFSKKKKIYINNIWMSCFDNKKSAFYTQKKRLSQLNDEVELVEDVIDVETGIEVAKENKREFI
ncbi:hypothetical protein BpHYR1_028389 [Brachionus plicatilis]|uniref:Uncharacterized protein n=1 Tax=Brachionus plicatilis TaxID=10195 RepID=A0A3M7RNJ6_BRAPC|nr:hypothetical protein BpHYR1_028389 [Brachionus plicatilis]